MPVNYYIRHRHGQSNFYCWNSPTKFVSGFRSEEKSSDPNRDLVKWSVSSDPDPPRLIKKRNIKSLYLLYICLQYLKDSVAVSEPRPFLEPNFDAAWTTRDVNVAFFCERTFRFFCPLEKKCVSFSFFNSKKSKDSFIVY